MTQSDVDYAQVLDEVAAVAGFELTGRLEDAVIDRMREARDDAIRQHAEIVMAAIRGDLVAWPSCNPQWRNRPPGS